MMAVCAGPGGGSEAAAAPAGGVVVGAVLREAVLSAASGKGAIRLSGGVDGGASALASGSRCGAGSASAAGSGSGRLFAIESIAGCAGVVGAKATFG